MYNGVDKAQHMWLCTTYNTSLHRRSGHSQGSLVASHAILPVRHGQGASCTTKHRSVLETFSPSLNSS